MELETISQIDEPLRQLIRRTGQFAREEFHRFSFSDVRFKRERDPVSYVDINAEKMLKEGCLRLIPGSGFINEESEDTPSENGWMWIIDPIDGTTNYTHGLANFCISLALQFEGATQMAYIYAPILEEMFTARKGKGAFLNDQAIAISERPNLAEALISTGFPYANFPWRDQYLALIISLMDQAHGLRRMGSAALDLAYVAAGRFEGYFEYGLSPWDVAAGALIVQEAGGKVSDFNGEDDYLYGSQIVVSNGNIHQDLLQEIRKHIPQEKN
ncbi:MAG: inositol monophosphatase family protein [Bacteroidota bacterium]